MRDLDRRARACSRPIPRSLPSARLLRALDYEEAQEIADHAAPRCSTRAASRRCAAHRIPLHVRCTDRPGAPGTVISGVGPATGPAGQGDLGRAAAITLVSMETVGHVAEVGFLAEVFACFARHGLSIDSVSTSETNVTVSLDPGANALEPECSTRLLRDLAALCEPRVIAPTARRSRWWDAASAPSCTSWARCWRSSRR